uniref:HIT domain-containing protein n=1 Tax=viral metagenome TaxID=1070528 RepID=A0A6C0I881_9ZZZZ
MSGITENIRGVIPSDFDKDHEPLNLKKCYSCNPRGTLKEHIISQTDHFVFNHDLFKRPLIIITSRIHYHTIHDIPDTVKLQLFEDIKMFVNFWNLNTNYQLMLNNGDSQTHHHFHIKMKINEQVANRMRRDHFTRINLQKNYNDN